MRKSPTDEKWMGEALKLAERGEGKTSPNPPVGAVAVKKGRIVGRGWHRRAGADHAEAAAIKDAGSAIRGAELFVTLEPCSTTGRTGPCTRAIIESGIRRTVVSVRDPNPKHRGRGLRELRQAGIETVSGVCSSEGFRLIAPFTRWIEDGRSYLTLKLGTTLDGKIADRNGRSRWITGRESRIQVRRIRLAADAVMVGVETVLADDPCLLVRGDHRRKRRIIVDSRGRTPTKARVLSDGRATQTIIATTSACPENRAAAYTRTGAYVLTVPARNGRVSLRALLKKLAGLDIVHVLCEGGGDIAECLIRRKLADRLIMFYAPIVMGGGHSRSSVGGRGWRLSSAPGFKITDVSRPGNDLMITALPRNRKGD